MEKYEWQNPGQQLELPMRQETLDENTRKHLFNPARPSEGKPVWISAATRPWVFGEVVFVPLY